MTSEPRYQHYFCVYGTIDDEGRIVWRVDGEAAPASDGTIWDTEEERWLSISIASDDPSDGLEDADERLGADLITRLYQTEETQ